MKQLFIGLFLIACATSCTTNKQMQYLQDVNHYPKTKIISNKYTLQPNDILKIDVYSTNTEAAIPYNKLGAFSSKVANATLQSLQLEGYLISSEYKFNFPILGDISVKNKTVDELEAEIIKRLVQGQHLLDPLVNVRLLNGKFTVLGEVQKPGTYSFVENRISILQALGYAGDLTIDGIRKEINLIREMDGERNVYTIDLTDTETMNATTFYMQPNDVIIVQPNFRKVKSAGFIGNPSSIASISSLLLSITLLLINN
jgi:polysaccharide export outer membrane protein